MTSLEEIHNKVQEKTNSQSALVIIGVYKNLVKLHNDFCGCNYCKVLVDYVRMKKYLCAENRRLNYVEDDVCGMLDWPKIQHYRSNVDRIRNKIVSLRQEKNKLKILN